MHRWIKVKPWINVRTEMFWGAFGKQRESKLMWRRVADCSRHDFLRLEKHGRRRWQAVFVRIGRINKIRARESVLVGVYECAGVTITWHTLVADSSAAAWRSRSSSRSACWQWHTTWHWQHVVRLDTECEVRAEINSCWCCRPLNAAHRLRR